MNYLVELIIRPVRNYYNTKDLGDATFSFSGQEFKRVDFNTKIKNERGNNITCSFWCPLEMSAKELPFSPVIIYCHGNAGNKIDIIEILEFLLWDFNICGFDFSGAGHSEGDYVTLGYLEKYDIKAVVDFLRDELSIQKIILYGRSMGAVAALNYAEMDENIKAIVLDSPFSDFPSLCKEILSNKFYLPKIISSPLISIARDKILSRLPNFDIYDFSPLKNAKNVQVPTLLIHGTKDSLVNVEHSRAIYNNLPVNTYKKLIEVDGEHNDSRPMHCVSLIRDFIMQFAYDSLVVKEHKRRLNIKNIHLNYTHKYGINLNTVISNFKSSVRKSLKEEAKSIRKMNNFNFDLRKKVTDTNYTASEFSKKSYMCNIRSKSSDTYEDVLISKLNKQETKTNNKVKHLKRDFSNNRNYNTNNLSIAYNICIIKDYSKEQNKNEINLIEEKNGEKSENNLNSINETDNILNFSSLNNPGEEENKINENEAKVVRIKRGINMKLNPSSMNSSQMQIDEVGLKSNLTFGIANSKISNKNKLRSERNNILGGILGCEVRIKSNQIQITSLDKTVTKRSSTDEVLETDISK